MRFLQFFLIGFLTFLPLQFAIGAGEGIDLAIVRIIVAVTILAWLILLPFQKNIRFPQSAIFWLGWTFLISMLLSILWANEPSWALRKAAFLLNFFPLYALAAWMFLEKRWGLEDMARGFAFAGGLSAIIALVQFSLPFFIGLNPTLDLWRTFLAPFFLGEAFSQSVITHSSWLVNLGGETVFRAVGTFPDPHIAAFFWELCLPWAIFLAIRKQSLFYAIISFVILLAILLTFSRGAYVALFIGSAISLFFLPIRKKRFFLFFNTSFLFLILLLSFFPSNPIFDRALSSFSTTDGSNIGRLEMWRIAGETILEKPFGVGLGNFSLEVLPSATYRDPIYAHNLFLDIAAESGIITLILWIFWTLGTIILALKHRRRHPYLIATAFSLILFSVHAIFDTPLYSVHILPVLLLVLASVFVQYKVSRKQQTL
jgi:O-antigen ligase